MADNKRTLSVASNHSITLDNRSKMSVGGVMDVAAFSDEKIEILTTMGKLVVHGKSLNVNTLNTDTGELKLTGEVKSLDYTDTHKGGGLFAGLFK